MSDHEKMKNALRKGKKAYWDGENIEKNPMLARDSRLAWREGWYSEQRANEASKSDMAGKITEEKQ